MAATRAEPAAAEPGHRIALVIDYSLEYLGGAQSAFLDEAALLRSRGHEVTIVAPWPRTVGRSEPAWFARWRELGGTTVAVPYVLTLPGVDLPVVRNSTALRRRLEYEFAARRIEAVHVHSEFGLSAAAVSVARRRGVPTVQTVHTFFWQAPMPRAIGRLAASGVRGFARWLRGFPSSRAHLADAPLDSALRGVTLGLGQRVDVVVSPSAHQAERLRAAGLSRVEVVPNALATADEPGEPLERIDGPLRIVWVGRLVPEKRILEWVRAVVAAVAILPPGALEVEIVGEGPLRAGAEALAAAVQGITFLGRLPREEVHGRMRDAHLVALTSFGFDNQPVTIVEALNARRGVLYVDPALTEGVDVAGIRAEGPDVESMSDLLVALAEDPARVVEASRNAERGAREFDPDEHVRRILSAYGLGGT